LIFIEIIRKIIATYNNRTVWQNQEHADKKGIPIKTTKKIKTHPAFPL